MNKCKLLLCTVVVLAMTGCAQGLSKIDKVGLVFEYHPLSGEMILADTSESGTKIEGLEGEKTADGGFRIKIEKAERQQAVQAVVDLMNQRIAALESLNVNYQKQLGANTVAILDASGRFVQSVPFGAIGGMFGGGTVTPPSSGIGGTVAKIVASLDWATFKEKVQPRVLAVVATNLSNADKRKAIYGIMQETGWGQGAVDSILRQICPSCFEPETPEPAPVLESTTQPASSDAGTHVPRGTDALTAFTAAAHNPKMRPAVLSWAERVLRTYRPTALATIQTGTAHHATSDLLR